MANIYMEFFESRLLPQAPLFSQVVSWKRYVDDVISVVPTSFSINDFLLQINNLTPSIKFTYETQVDGCIPFLDILIIQTGTSLSFNFKVYRKPTHTNQLLHYFSSPPLHIKNNVIFNMFLRSFNYCDPCLLYTSPSPR